MAFQVGNIKISGHYDGYLFYERLGIHLVRRSYFPSKGALKSKATYLNNRLAGARFAACAKLASELYRDAKVFLPYLDKWHGVARLTIALQKVAGGSRATLGGPGLNMSQYKQLALGMELNSKRNLVDVVKMPFAVYSDSTAKTVVVNFSEFTPARLNLKQGTVSMLRLFGFMVVMEDMVLNPDRKVFEAQSDLKPFKTRFSFGEYIPLIDNKPRSISLKIDVSDILPTGVNAPAWVFVGAELCRYYKNNLEVLPGMSVCKLVQVAVL